MVLVYMEKKEQLFEEAVKTLKQAVKKEIPYDSDQPNIKRAERMLRIWLEGIVNEETTLFMELLYREFRDIFSYSGKLYRGIRVEPGAPLYPMSVASFSSQRYVACKFAGTEDFEGEYEDEAEEIFIETEGSGALALDDLQFELMGLTTNRDFYHVMDDMVGEHEKLFPMSEELVNMYY